MHYTTNSPKYTSALKKARQRYGILLKKYNSQPRNFQASVLKESSIFYCLLQLGSPKPLLVSAVTTAATSTATTTVSTTTTTVSTFTAIAISATTVTTRAGFFLGDADIR